MPPAPSRSSSRYRPAISSPSTAITRRPPARTAPPSPGHSGRPGPARSASGPVTPVSGGSSSFGFFGFLSFLPLPCWSPAFSSVGSAPVSAVPRPGGRSARTGPRPAFRAAWRFAPAHREVAVHPRGKGIDLPAEGGGLVGRPGAIAVVSRVSRPGRATTGGWMRAACERPEFESVTAGGDEAGGEGECRRGAERPATPAGWAHWRHAERGYRGEGGCGKASGPNRRR